MVSYLGSISFTRLDALFNRGFIAQIRPIYQPNPSLHRSDSKIQISIPRQNNFKELTNPAVPTIKASLGEFDHGLSLFILKTDQSLYALFHTSINLQPHLVDSSYIPIQHFQIFQIKNFNQTVIISKVK
ncbi:uncharacterized protein MELLADRAFT_95647 [Melampsora larici-populina 98AG31]|uniref:Uncharacterized protein n=1 Tax=Melampsora larici-populina (strain 98AG31 / pathotype 3-4-7) TaxID=747676 RepID=F4SA28_MELLP|nr:uncharacterized protein MELLADRAFT_95647 [Melampsora larici-populina 98AG31]EGF98511.1 hypothetical protein MELLADRAFT_95647 [Melampsora larici-populina 98AG31]